MSKVNINIEIDDHGTGETSINKLFTDLENVLRSKVYKMEIKTETKTINVSKV